MPIPEMSAETHRNVDGAIVSTFLVSHARPEAFQQRKDSTSLL